MKQRKPILNFNPFRPALRLTEPEPMKNVQLSTGRKAGARLAGFFRPNRGSRVDFDTRTALQSTRRNLADWRIASDAESTR